MEIRERALGRIPHFDDRSRSFAAVAPNDTRPFRSYTWDCDVYNDQGREGACVGFAWSHELSARPWRVRRDDNFAMALYRRCQIIDGYNWEAGTTVLAGAKATQEHRNRKGQMFFEEYRWAFGIKDTLRVIGYAGPVVLGIDWYDSMYDPDSRGFITPAGPKVGGHAILATGVRLKRVNVTRPATYDNLNLDESYVRLHNSWGTNYGLGGDALISVRDLDKLLDDGGEACVPSIRHGE